jgi:signal transduction histidine kinase
VRELARSFNDTAAKLEALVHSQEQFVADASHELRTPLTALRLRLENVEHAVSPAGLDDLDAATEELERLDRMVEDLLALARADVSEAPAEEVVLADLVAERARAWDAYAAERGIALVTELDGRQAARAGRGRTEQVVDNLLANAIEASPTSGSVWLRARAGPGAVTVSVVDEGPGLTPVERERAFDRFWRGASGSGSGLGLSIVRRLVELDGGRVELREAGTGGVEAVVTLPSARPTTLARRR